MFSSEVERALAEIGKEATAVTPALAILKGIFAGWLIAMVVWMLASARTGHIAIIFILTYIVGLGQFTHVIAGSQRRQQLEPLGGVILSADAARQRPGRCLASLGPQSRPGGFWPREVSRPPTIICFSQSFRGHCAYVQMVVRRICLRYLD
jgi:Formate/nitrite transporter